MKKIGKQVLFLETSANNPRNGEGAFIKLKDGAILFGFTEFTGKEWDDDAQAHIAFVVSFISFYEIFVLIAESNSVCLLLCSFSISLCSPANLS